jgi:RNA polymerase sigma-70 factor (ECF subfamily)
MALPIATPSDVDLIARIRMGDEHAFDQLFRRYHRSLCLYSMRIVKSMERAEEIVQDVFLRVWLHRERLQDVQSLAGYLLTAVRNHSLNAATRDPWSERWRGATLTELQEHHAESASADEDVAAAELARAVDEAVAQLPPRCREVFLLRTRDRMSHAEIARTMGITPKTVENQIGHALKHLRKALADWI